MKPDFCICLCTKRENIDDVPYYQFYSKAILIKYYLQLGLSASLVQHCCESQLLA